MKIIEFIALPGAGKSTIRNLLIKQFQQERHDQWITVEEAFYLAAKKNIDAHIRLPLKITPAKIALRLGNKIENRSQWQQQAQNCFLAKHGMALSFFLTSYAFQHSSVIDRQKGIHAFLRTGSLYQCIKQQEFSKQNIIFDEGMIQKSIMFIPTQVELNQQEDSSNISGYLNSVPKPDVVIFIKTSIENSLQRMHSRPDGLTERLQSRDEKQILSFLSRGMDHFEKTVTFLQAESDVKIITVENNFSLDVAVKSIMSELKKIN